MLAMHPIISTLGPELLLIAAASFMLLAGVSGSGRANRALPAFAFIVVLGALGLAFLQRDGAIQTPASLMVDSLSWYVRLITLSIGLAILLVNFHVPAEHERGEFFALLLFSLAGVLMVSVADDLILLFLSLELVSIPTYILIAMSRTDVKAQESSVKYFFLGSFAAALMLYGFSFLYGAGGTTTMFGSGGGASLAGHLASNPAAAAEPLTLIGLLLVFAGLAFKMAAVPFHFYAADVYQGAASPVTGMLGFVPKFAGLVALIRLMSMFGWNLPTSAFWMLWGVALASMTVGNLLGLMQHNAKRMLAYSGIAHTGYMLVAVLAGPGLAGETGPTRNGVSASLFYVAVYGLMNLGAFAALASMRRPDSDESIEEVDDLSGAATQHPGACLALAICVLSLMGFPPTAGFLGKFYVFSSAFASAGASTHGKAMIWLAILGFVNAAIAAGYYLRLIATCYLRPATVDLRSAGRRSLRAGLAVCAAAMLILFVVPALVSSEADPAGQVARSSTIDRSALQETAAGRATISAEAAR